MTKHFLLFLLTALTTVTSTVAQSDSTFSYAPHVHGVLRARFEASTEHGDYRFQLRNARVSLDGAISPAIDYFLQADFCDRGSFSFLDGWMRLKPAQGLSVTAGQFRMPFGVDAFRAPNNYIFGNRSFIGKQMFNYRAVGAKIGYTLPSTPLTIEAGAFNPTTIGDHKPWNRTLAYSAKATLAASKTVNIEAGFASAKPDSVRMNLFDAAVTWHSGRWLAEAEYLYEHYTHNSHKPCHGYNLFADYHMPVRAGIFNRLSFQARVDGMTAHSTGHRTSDGLLITNNPARNRVTVGSTISHISSPKVYADLRLNYEKYFYHSGVTPSLDGSDKLLLELVLRF